MFESVPDPCVKLVHAGVERRVPAAYLTKLAHDVTVVALPPNVTTRSALTATTLKNAFMNTKS